MGSDCKNLREGGCGVRRVGRRSSFLDIFCFKFDKQYFIAGGSKPATLDTGAVVNVPLFVNIGDEILVDTRTGAYMSRA